MAVYRISGIWKDLGGAITHYSFHVADAKANTFGSLFKLSKAEAIAKLETAGNSATTLIWDYSRATWKIGEGVTVVGSGSDRYLRSNPDNKLTDNSGHLINWRAVII